jgi:hypothetical protein
MSRASYLSVILKSVIWRNSCWVVARLPRRNGYSRTSVSNGAAKRGPTERGIVGWAFSCSGHTLGNSNVPTFRKSRGTLHPDLRPPTPAIRLVPSEFRAPLVLPIQYVIVALRRHPLRLPTGAVVNWPGNWLEGTRQQRRRVHQPASQWLRAGSDRLPQPLPEQHGAPAP